MTVEELQVVISANTKDFKTKIADINKKLRDVEKQTKSTAGGVEGATAKINKAFGAVKASAAVAAVHTLTRAVKKLTDAYSAVEGSQKGLESILSAQNKDIGKAKQFLKEYTKDGLIPLADAYAAYKNLASAGYSDDQTKSILKNLKDSAAFGRQGSLTMGEAVKSATEGIKNENSVLVDNAGVTKNLSVMCEEYARSIGKTVGALTEEEKRLATTQGLMRETAFQTGDAAKYTNTLAGAKSALNAQTTALSAALGSALAPALQAVIPHVTALAERLTVLAEKAGQVMAILFGKSAKTNSQPFKSVSDGAKSASSGIDKTTKKTKALKKALAGIDEIHNLDFGNPDSDAGGSSGGGSSSVISESNFESPLSDADKVIDPKIAKRAEELRNSLEKAKKTLSAFTPVFKGVVAAGAAALGVKVMSKWFTDAKSIWNKSRAMKVASSFISGFNSVKQSGGSFFKSFSGGFKNSVGVAKAQLAEFRKGLSITQKAMIGAAGFTGALVMSKDAFRALGEDADNAGAKLAVAGTATVALGTAMYAMLGPAGAVIAAVGAITGAMMGYVEGVDKQAEAIYKSSDSYKILSSSIQTSEEIIQRSKDNMQLLQEKIDGVTNASAQYGNVRLLVDEIYALSDKSNKSASDIELMRTKVDLLNGMNIDGVQLSFDETTGTIKETKDSIYRVIEALDKQAQMAAMTDVLKESYKALYRAQMDSELATHEQRVADEQLKDAQESLRKKQEELAASIPDNQYKGLQLFIMQHLNPEWRALKKNVDDAKEAQNKAKEAIDASKATMDDAKKKTEFYTKRITELRTELLKLPKNISGKIKYTAEIQGAPSGNVKGYATGGLPETGEVFVARERGPEMVGKIGSHTAVANNQQIVDGVSEGVAKAMRQAPQGQPVTVIIQVPGRGDIVQEISDVNLRAGKVVIPLDL